MVVTVLGAMNGCSNGDNGRSGPRVTCAAPLRDQVSVDKKRSTCATKSGGTSCIG
jgi:hypothetical protein